MVQLAEFTATLRQAIEESRTASMDASVRELEDRVFTAYATSSERFGEVGEAITRFLKINGRDLPAISADKFHRCLAEVGKLWPKYRR